MAYHHFFLHFNISRGCHGIILQKFLIGYTNDSLTDDEVPLSPASQFPHLQASSVTSPRLLGVSVPRGTATPPAGTCTPSPHFSSLLSQASPTNTILWSQSKPGSPGLHFFSMSLLPPWVFTSFSPWTWDFVVHYFHQNPWCLFFFLFNLPTYQNPKPRSTSLLITSECWMSHNIWDYCHQVMFLDFHRALSLPGNPCFLRQFVLLLKRATGLNPFKLPFLW